MDNKIQEQNNNSNEKYETMKNTNLCYAKKAVVLTSIDDKVQNRISVLTVLKY